MYSYSKQNGHYIYPIVVFPPSFAYLVLSSSLLHIPFFHFCCAFFSKYIYVKKATLTPSSRVKVLWLRSSTQYLDECGYRAQVSKPCTWNQWKCVFHSKHVLNKNNDSCSEKRWQAQFQPVLVVYMHRQISSYDF